jgi:hypothetical protein
MSTLQQINGRRAQDSPMVSPTADSAAGPNVALTRKRALRQIAIGVALLVVGLVITGVTYSHAASSPTGGTYIVAWGPVLVGVVKILRGLHALRLANTLY